MPAATMAHTKSQCEDRSVRPYTSVPSVGCSAKRSWAIPNGPLPVWQKTDEGPLVDLDSFHLLHMEPLSEDDSVVLHSLQESPAPLWVQHSEVLLRAQTILTFGTYNRFAARLPIPSVWNLGLFREWLGEYPDADDIIEFLRLGTSSRPFNAPTPTVMVGNHQGALLHASSVDEYICKELTYGTLVRPFTSPPSGVGLVLYPPCHLAPNGMTLLNAASSLICRGPRWVPVLTNSFISHHTWVRSCI